MRLVLLTAALMAATSARAELVVSNLIVDLQPGKRIRQDVEVWNNSPERSFVAVDAREIVKPSLADQSVKQDADPEKLGLLVTPARMILEAGQRKLLRVASLAEPADHERVYRVTVKPVVGAIQSVDSGLKILIGYDILVLVRPAKPAADVQVTRSGRELSFTNVGNVSAEIVDGRQCVARDGPCTPLPGKRLYPRASWKVQLPSEGPAEYTIQSPERTERRRL